MSSCEFIENPTPEEFNNLTGSLKRPLIIEKAMDDWPARAWTEKSFRKQFGNLKINVRENNSQGNWYKDTRPQVMTIADYLDLIKKKPHFYAGNNFLEGLAEIKEQIFVPKFLYNRSNPRIDSLQTLWLGKDILTPLHYDIRYNVLAQVWGEKTVTLIPPGKYSTFYPETDRTMSSQIHNPYDFNSKKFPLFDKTKAIQITLTPGQILFMPIFWWHFITAKKKLNCTITFHWFNPFSSMVFSPYFWAYFKNRPLGKFYELYFSPFDKKFFKGKVHQRLKKMIG